VRVQSDWNSNFSDPEVIAIALPCGSSWHRFDAAGPAFASSDNNAFPNRYVFANGTDFGLSHICGPRRFMELRQHSRFPRFSAVFGFRPRPKDHGERSRRSITAGSNFDTSPAEALGRFIKTDGPESSPESVRIGGFSGDSIPSSGAGTGTDCGSQPDHEQPPGYLLRVRLPHFHFDIGKESGDEPSLLTPYMAHDTSREVSSRFSSSRRCFCGYTPRS